MSRNELRKVLKSTVWPRPAGRPCAGREPDTACRANPSCLLLTSELAFCELDAWVEPFDPHPTKESNHVQGVHQLPTSDLERSKAFYTALGCAIAPEFTDENAACVVWSDDTFFMMLTREYFSTFTDKTIVDPNEAAQVSVAFARDSREDPEAVIAGPGFRLLIGGQVSAAEAVERGIATVVRGDLRVLDAFASTFHIAPVPSEGT